MLQVSHYTGMSLTSPPAELACPSPSVDVDGNITFSPPGQAQFVGTVASYQCNTGFNLIGSNVRYCQESGDWNGTEPSCQS